MLVYDLCKSRHEGGWGLSQRETARRLGISQPAVHKLLRKARRHLGEGVGGGHFAMDPATIDRMSPEQIRAMA